MLSRSVASLAVRRRSPSRMATSVALSVVDTLMVAVIRTLAAVTVICTAETLTLASAANCACSAVVFS
tara:strand:- start:131 stop:334 length:204 start_codon:yes stop_codon:yes gene_type:complete